MADATIGEEWRPVPGYEDTYSVSNMGRVRRDIPNPTNGCQDGVMNGGVRCAGYRVVGLRRNGVRKTVDVHRLVAMAFVPGFGPGLQVNHKNGRPTDNRASNLEWVTPRQNSRHARVVLGANSNQHGENNPASKLKEAEVLEIAHRAAAGESCKELAARFGVCVTCIYNIARGRKWKRLLGAAGREISDA